MKRDKFDDQISSLFEANYTCNEIAHQVPLDAASIRLRLKELNAWVKKPKKSDKADRNQLMKARYLEVKSYAQVAREFGVSRERAEEIIKKLLS